MRIHKKAAALAVAAVTVAGVGTAYAYWTTTGTGTGTGTVAASNGNLTNKLTATVPDGIFPGGSVTVTYKATNSSATDLYVGTVTPTVTTSNAGCLPAWFTISPTTINKSVPGNTTVAMTLGTETLSLANAYDSSTPAVALNQDACKSPTTVTLTLASD